MVSNGKPIEILMPLQIDKVSEERQKEIAGLLDLPSETQPDLMYFSGILVSSGANLNHAYFTQEELIKAEKSVFNKPVDIEHEEDKIIGHIYDRAYVDRNANKKLPLEELQKLSPEEKASLDLDIAIAGVIYKDRFPKIAKEIEKGSWYLSMETYFSDFNIKIGDLEFSKEEADVLGLTDLVGNKVSFIKDGKEIANDVALKVLKNISFCGCGIVKKPANPGSVFLDTAAKKETSATKAVMVKIENIDKAALEDPKPNDDGASKSDDDNGTVDNKGQGFKESGQTTSPDMSLTGPGANIPDTLVSQCPYFEKEDNRCSIFDTGCTSKTRQLSDKSCLYYQKYFMSEVSAAVKEVLDDILESSNLNKLVSKLNRILNSIKKF